MQQSPTINRQRSVQEILTSRLTSRNSGDSSRRAAVVDLVSNEQEYLSSLDFIVAECIPVLKQKMNQHEINATFSNIEVIRAFHQMLAVEFAQQVNLPLEKQKIGAIIVKYGDFLKLYKTYCIAQQSPEPHQNLEKCKSRDMSEMKYHGQTVDEVLLLPTKRLAAYQPLLNTILKHTPPDFDDYEHLKEAIAKLEEVQHWIEESSKHNEEEIDKAEKLKDVHGSETVQINGKLLKEDDFERIGGNNKDKERDMQYHYYLFSDMLMTAYKSKKGYHLHKVFYYNQTLAREIPNDPQHAIEILDIESSKRYQFGMKSESEKKEMLKFLQDSIYSHTFLWTEERSNTFAWFYEDLSATESLWDMVLVYRNFHTSIEFLTALETRFSNCDHVAVEILRTFMEGIKRSDVGSDQWPQIQEKLLKLVNTKVTNLSAKTALLQILETMKFIAPKTRRHALKLSEQTTVEAGKANKNRVSLAFPESPLSLSTSPPQSRADKRPTIAPKDVAEEITQSEWNILRSVYKSELLNTHWSKSNASELAPNILSLIERFNWTSHWISSKILRRDTPAKRADAIVSFIEMGKVFRQLNNFNGIMEVLSSLHSTPISRLKETWSLIPPSAMADFQGLTDLMRPDKNSHNYREAIAAVPYQDPCMPYLGLFLSDLTFTEETGKFTNGTVINTNYTSLVGTKLRTFKSYQRRKYKFMKPLYSIYGELVFGEDELYKLSKLREESSAPVESAKLSLLRVESRKVAKDRKSHGPTLGDDETISVDMFSKRDWQVLLANAETITLRKGEVLLKEGEDSESIYVVNSGLLRVQMKDGHTLEVGPGEVTSKTLRGDPFTDTHVILGLVAAEESVVSAVNRHFLYRIFETETELAARFYKYTANQMNNTLRTLMMNYANRSPAPATNKRRSVRLDADSVNLNDADKVFSATFKSISNEVVVKSYFCKGGVFAGQLFVTKNYICFSAKAFGLHKKKVIHLPNVADISISKGCLEVLRDHKVKPKKFVFHTEKELEDCSVIATSLWSSARSRQVNPLYRARSNSGGTPVEDQSTLTAEDWKLILKGTKCITYESGAKLITEGVRPTALYQIARGTCSVQVQIGQSVTTIATRKEGDIFGELSFLDESQVASASVICDGQVDVYILDYNFVHIILSVYKYLAPKFYRYLALLLWSRIIQFMYRN